MGGYSQSRSRCTTAMPLFSVSVHLTASQSFRRSREETYMPPNTRKLAAMTTVGGNVDTAGIHQRAEGPETCPQPILSSES